MKQYQILFGLAINRNELAEDELLFFLGYATNTLSIWLTGKKKNPICFKRESFVMSEDAIKNNIFMYLVLNQHRYKNQLNPFIVQRINLLEREDKLFHEEIERQFKDQVSRIITDDVTKQLAIPAELVLELLEAMNINTYLELQ